MNDLPCTKRQYTDKKAAQSAANLRKRNGGGRGRRGRQKTLRVYRCDQCDAWHLTHKPKYSPSTGAVLYHD